MGLARTTAFQVSNGSVSYPTMVPSDGRITAWHIALGGLHKQFFDEGYGSPSEAAIAVIAPQSTEPQSYKLVALGPVETLEPYFFKTAQFALSTPIPVKKGEIVALTVPTWAPALALGLRQRHLIPCEPINESVRKRHRPDEPGRRREFSAVLMRVPDCRASRTVQCVT